MEKRTQEHGEAASPALALVVRQFYLAIFATHKVCQAISATHEGNDCDADWGLPPEKQRHSYEHEDIVQRSTKQLMPAVSTR